MKRLLTLILFLFSLLNSQAQSKKIQFETEFGTFKVLLHDFTPNHRDLMLQSIQDLVYQKTLFNRIIENFVVQGGEHDIDIAKREAADPSGHKPRLAAEFHKKAFHKIGALGAGRDDNPDKASFLNQIYFVLGTTVTAKDLNHLEKTKSIKFTKKQRKTYLKQGGLPRLDKDYTVFGEIYEGLEVILRISKVKTDKADYPIQAVPFQIKEIN